MPVKRDRRSADCLNRLCRLPEFRKEVSGLSGGVEPLILLELRLRIDRWGCCQEVFRAKAFRLRPPSAQRGTSSAWRSQRAGYRWTGESSLGDAPSSSTPVHNPAICELAMG